MGIAHREWTVGVRLNCSMCARSSETSCVSTSAEDARQSCLKVLRYRGWEIRPKQGVDLCPDHAPPLRPCDICGDPTPKEYAVDSQHVTHVRFACPGCYRLKFREKQAERYAHA